MRLTGDDLSIEDVVSIARRGAIVEVSRGALERVRRARDVVDRVLERGDPVYGMNTGVGSLSRYRIPFEGLEQFSVRLVTRHTTHQGAELGTEVVRAMMVTRANGMAKGGVGVRAELIQAFLDALNAGVHPEVRTGGSVGQADLAEMAEIGQVLIGRGSTSSPWPWLSTCSASQWPRSSTLPTSASRSTSGRSSPACQRDSLPATATRD